MPWRASTSERPCVSQPCARDPGTAVMSAPGCGLSADGRPKGFGDCAVSAAQAPTASTAVARVRRREVRPATGRGRVAGMRLLRDCLSSCTSDDPATFVRREEPRPRRCRPRLCATNPRRLPDGNVLAGAAAIRSCSCGGVHGERRCPIDVRRHHGRHRYRGHHRGDAGRDDATFLGRRPHRGAVVHHPRSPTELLPAGATPASEPSTCKTSLMAGRRHAMPRS